MGLTFSYVFCLNFVSLDYKLLPTQRLKKHVFIMQPFLWVKSLGLTATSAHDLPRLQVSARCMSIRSPDQGRARSRLVQAGGRIYFRAPARLETPVSRWPSGGSCSPVSEATYTIPCRVALSLRSRTWLVASSRWRVLLSDPLRSRLTKRNKTIGGQPYSIDQEQVTGSSHTLNLGEFTVG